MHSAICSLQIEELKVNRSLMVMKTIVTNHIILNMVNVRC